MKSVRGPRRTGKRRATLKDVAELAGVSPMTVSNVVNGRDKGYNTETRDRVLRAVRSARYRPDIAARSLRTDKRMSVGMLVVQDDQKFVTDRQFLTAPYITHLLDGLCAGLNQHGYTMTLQGMPSSQFDRSPMVRQRLTDGLCIMISGAFDPHSALADTLRSMGQPIVLFQQKLEQPHDDICVLRQDDYGGARMLCAHLIDRGARRIVMVMPPPEWAAMKLRQEGVRDYIADSGADVELVVLTTVDESPTSSHAALAGHIESGKVFDAVIGGNDQMAIGIYRMLKQRGISVPGEVKVAGFNGLPFLDFFEARLTTVRSPAFHLGGLGAHHIVSHIETGMFETNTVVLPVELMHGETT